MFDLEFWVQENRVKQPVQVNAMSLGNMPRGRAQAFGDHLYHRIDVFKHDTRCPLAGDA